MEFHKLLRNLLKTKDIEQKELADKINVRTATISSYATGKTEPNATIILNICNALQISPNQLFEWEDDTKDTDTLISDICVIEGFNRDGLNALREYVEYMRHNERYGSKIKERHA